MTSLRMASRPPGPTYKVGQYYQPFGVTDAGALNANLLMYVPLLFLTPHKFTGVFIHTTAAGVPGSTVRFGLYADNGAGAPGALIADYGPINTAAAPGVLGLTGLAIPVTGPVWFAIASQGTGPCSANLSKALASIPAPTDVANGALGGALRDTNAVPGALPAVASPGLAISFVPVFALLA